MDKERLDKTEAKVEEGRVGKPRIDNGNPVVKLVQVDNVEADSVAVAVAERTSDEGDSLL